jgi:hypothetical protein
MSLKLPHAAAASDSSQDLLGSAMHQGASGLLVPLLAGLALVVGVALVAYLIAIRRLARR